MRSVAPVTEGHLAPDVEGWQPDDSMEEVTKDMGMGYALALFLTLAVVVPIAGLIWFALDEIFTDGGRGGEARDRRSRFTRVG